MIDETIMQSIKPGAKVRVHEEQGSFEGLVLARKHGSEAGATFTVRTTLKGVGEIVRSEISKTISMQKRVPR